MDLTITSPYAIDAWHDSVGESLAQVTKSSVSSFNQGAENFSSTYEQAQMVLYRSIQYSSKEGEIRGLTVSA